MGRLVLFCFLVAQIVVLQAMAIANESQASGPNPLELKNHTEVETHHDETAKAADKPVSEDTDLSEKHGESESEAAKAPESRKLRKHHSADKSVAGGGVIIAGLVTAIFGAVVCYIRVTRRKDIAP